MIKSILFSLICIAPSIVAMDGKGYAVVTATNSRPTQPRMAGVVLKQDNDASEIQHEHCCMLLTRLILNGSMAVIEFPLLTFDTALEMLNKKNN